MTLAAQRMASGSDGEVQSSEDKVCISVWDLIGGAVCGAEAGAGTFSWSQSLSRYTEVSALAPAPGSDSRTK